MNRRLYALHRWLSAVAFLQLAAWTLSGAIFAFLPIENVRGPFVADAHLGVVEGSTVLAPREALSRAAAAGLAAPSELALRASPSGQFWVVRAKGSTLRLDARTGEPAPVTREEAVRTACRDQPGTPRAQGATLEASAPLEYRGKPVPVWRVQMDDAAGTSIYVDATTGDVTARRSDLWRVYDFFWSLHIMDYRQREGFNHALLRCAALLAVITVMSGLALWALRARRWLRGRRAVANAAASRG